jgi:hypothetical protein
MSENELRTESEQAVDQRQKLEDHDVPVERAADVSGGGGGVPGSKTPKSFPGQGIRIWH